MQIADDGTRVIRTDTWNGYVRGLSDTAWTPLIQMGVNLAIGDGKYNYANGPGAYEAAIAATDSNHILINTMGNHYLTTDRGASWAKLSILAGNQNFDANGPYRTSCRRMMFDPAGTAVLCTTDPTVTTGGFHFSLDSGANWTKNTSIPAGVSNKPFSIAFDRSSSVVSGKTQSVFVSSPGNGIYHSSTGLDGTFSLISGSPTDLCSMEVAGGKLFTAGAAGGDGPIKMWDGSWSTLAGGANAKAIAIDPVTPAHMIAMQAGGQYIASVDSGATWTTFGGTVSRSGGEIPWHSTTNESYMSNGGVAFNPVVSGQLEVGEGIGTFLCPAAPLTQSPAVVWQDSSRGIENMVVQDILVLPSSGRVVVSTQDRNFRGYAKSAVGTYPGQFGVNNLAAINHGNSLDHAADNELWVFGVCTGRRVEYGSLISCGQLSTDGGDTWAGTNMPENVVGSDGPYGGSVAVGNAGNIVWAPAGNAAPSYSTDGGTTWALSKFAGVTLPAGVYTHNSYTLHRNCLVNDKQNPTTFYMLIWGTDSDATLNTAYAGVWESTDRGANFVRKFVGRLAGGSSNIDFYHGHLKIPHGRTDLFWCAGDVGLDDVGSAVFAKISVNGGTNWADIPGLYEPESIGFSAPAPGASYPTLYGFGYSAVADTAARGVFRCTNFDPANLPATIWTKIGDYPGGDYDSGTTITGDPGQWDRFYVGKGGSGAFCYN